MRMPSWCSWGVSIGRARRGRETPPDRVEENVVAGAGSSRLRSGRSLLRPYRTLVEEMRRHVGLPAEHWDLLYRPLLEAFASFVQVMSEDGRGPLLLRRLRLALRVLSLRRDRLLTGGRGADGAADRQDVWTYALVTAALLKDLGEPMLARTVLLLDARVRPLGEWNPWNGSAALGEALHCRVRPGAPASPHLASLLPLVAAQTVVPAPGLRWLYGDPGVREAWLSSLSGRHDRSGELGRILAVAWGQIERVATPLRPEQKISIEAIAPVEERAAPSDSAAELAQCPPAATSRPTPRGTAAALPPVRARRAP